MLGSRMTKGPCVASLLPPLSGRQLTHSPTFVPPHPRRKEPGGQKSGLADVKASAQHGSQVVASVCRRLPDVLLIGVNVPRGHALQVPVQTPSATGGALCMPCVQACDGCAWHEGTTSSSGGISSSRQDTQSHGTSATQGQSARHLTKRRHKRVCRSRAGKQDTESTIQRRGGQGRRWQTSRALFERGSGWHRASQPDLPAALPRPQLPSRESCPPTPCRPPALPSCHMSPARGRLDPLAGRRLAHHQEGMPCTLAVYILCRGSPSSPVSGCAYMGCRQQSRRCMRCGSPRLKHRCPLCTACTRQATA